MSLIEKAAGKLGKTGTPPTADTSVQSTPVDDSASLVERAVSRDAQPTPAAAAPARPVESVPAAKGGSSQLVELNLARLKHMGIVTPNAERSQTAEEFRLIKRPLLMNAFGEGAAPVPNGNLIVVTSSLPGEGKSFCAISLAMSIAMEMDRTVLLVDADVAKPRIPEYLGIKGEKGLLDVLRDPSLSLSDVMLRTNVEKLSILPSGKTYKRATELLASESMKSLVRDIANRYPDRVIIFDSPPLLSTSEASVLASHMGQIVMVVEAERTPQEAVKEALSQIESCEVVGMLLNKARPFPGTDYYYGYYGGYGA